MTAYKKHFGKRGEDLAIEYLEEYNFDILFNNFRSKFGEIDIIAEKDRKIYFIEVKTRANLNKGKPYESVTPRKIHQMKKAATYFLLTNDYKKYKHTISVISIVLETEDKYDLKFYESVD